jgi:hypothetical protein
MLCIKESKTMGGRRKILLWAIGIIETIWCGSNESKLNARQIGSQAAQLWEEWQAVHVLKPAEH